MSEYDEGGSTDVEDVAPGLCSRPVPTATCVAGSRSVGCEARGKAQGSPSRLGVTGEGKAGRVNNSLCSTGRSDTRLDLGRAPVRWSADRAGVHLPLSRPDGGVREGPRSSRVSGCRVRLFTRPTYVDL
jgi:hypothetical protein